MERFKHCPYCGYYIGGGNLLDNGECPSCLREPSTDTGVMSGKGGDITITKQKPSKGAKKPGNLEIRAGLGAAAAPGGDIIFVRGDGSEHFRIKSDGVVFINGERCTHDKELYDAMRDFFKKGGGTVAERENMNEILTMEEVAVRAEPAARTLATLAINDAPDVLSAIVALETAKRVIVAKYRERYGEAFFEQAQNLLQKFEDFYEISEAVNVNDAFMQPGGES